MKWLKDFKRMIDDSPEITDPELYRAFPELKGDSRRMDAALIYWKYGVVAEEFKTRWQKLWTRIIRVVAPAIG